MPNLPTAGQAQTNEREIRPTRIQQLTSLLPAAQRVLDIHVTEETGLCQGCRELWARLAPYPCPQARWATSVTNRIPSPATLAVLGLNLDDLAQLSPPRPQT